MNQLFSGEECQMGIAISSRSSSSNFIVSAPVMPLMMTLRWVWRQPFGFPVVPDVYRISAKSFSEIGTA